MKVEDRAADDLEHVGSGRLLLQRLPQFAEQPRVLDRDDGLGGEGPEKPQLFICKRINFGSSKSDCSDRHPLTQEWNASCRPLSKPSCESTSFGKFLGLCLKVDYMHELPIDNGTASNTPTCARVTITDLLWDRTAVGGYTYVLPIQFENGHVVRFAVARRTPCDDFQHRLEFARRRADDLKNLSCGPLLFQRLGELSGALAQFAE